jgi:predicted pyridoxine 5'-phosphate oxidase superfamily flavin-nucleotide-binding protein
VQAREGVRERLEQVGRKIIRSFMPEQHREFFRAQSLLIAAGLDSASRLWATALSGEPGFASSPEPKTLRVSALPDSFDPLASAFQRGDPVGLLGIHFETRRRNRLNGTVSARDEHGFAMTVRQSFGNCPQYIQARRELAPHDRGPARVHSEGALLSSAARDWIGRADTFFFASASADPRGEPDAQGLDVSHRGGKPGFVRVSEHDGRSVLTVPDFRGNFQFNTLGNLVENPQAAFLFVDFESGSLLSLTGLGEIVWDGAELASFEGAERLVRFSVLEARSLGAALPLRWSEPELSPHLGRTGAWPSRAPLEQP